MTALYLLKVTLCSAFLYAYYHLALRNRVFHQYNRFYLLAAVLFSLVFPLVPAPWPMANTNGNDALELYRLLYSSGGNNVVVSANRSQSWNWSMLPVILYTTVSLYLLVRLLAGLWQLRQLVAKGTVSRLGAVRFIPTLHQQAPFSFFSFLFWKPDIDLESDGGQSILRHELVHIREHHSFDKLLMQLVLLACWANPVFWIIRRELHLIHEFIADRKAVPNASTETLAAMILQSVFGNNYPTLVNPFFQQPVKRRIDMLHKALKQPSNSWMGRVMTLPLCAVLLLAFAKPGPNKQPVTNAPHTFATLPLVDTLPIKDTQNIKEMHVDATGDSVHVVTITYKDGTKSTYRVKPNKQEMNSALVLIDGKEVGRMADLEGDKFPVKPEQIKSMNVLKDKNATDKYGDKGKHGVIEITTKKQ